MKTPIAHLQKKSASSSNQDFIKTCLLIWDNTVWKYFTYRALIKNPYHLPLRHDNRTIKDYERPCGGLEEVSLTSITEKLK